MAVEVGRKREVVGFDINQQRIGDLKAGQDFTLEITPEELTMSTQLIFSTKLDDLR